MRKSRFTDEQVIGFIKQADVGMRVAGRRAYGTECRMRHVASQGTGVAAAQVARDLDAHETVQSASG